MKLSFEVEIPEALFEQAVRGEVEQQLGVVSFRPKELEARKQIAQQVAVHLRGIDLGALIASIAESTAKRVVREEFEAEARRRARALAKTKATPDLMASAGLEFGGKA